MTIAHLKHAFKTAGLVKLFVSTVKLKHCVNGVQHTQKFYAYFMTLEICADYLQYLCFSAS